MMQIDAMFFSAGENVVIEGGITAEASEHG